ncbi:IS3 family transposase, partial [Jeotgalibaca arthritidis]|uniref:IS3 family transposase n=1 Tax=Jeotgalibaca arthritidis TaxID=1868794 RepID=UPI0035A0DCF6
ELELFDYVHWWNHLRLHGTLGYETPIHIRYQRLAQQIHDHGGSLSRAIGTKCKNSIYTL